MCVCDCLIDTWNCYYIMLSAHSPTNSVFVVVSKIEFDIWQINLRLWQNFNAFSKLFPAGTAAAGDIMVDVVDADDGLCDTDDNAAAYIIHTTRTWADWKLFYEPYLDRIFLCDCFLVLFTCTLIVVYYTVEMCLIYAKRLRQWKTSTTI